ncbi:MAG: tRNA (adenosine(37)-N6)-dimethylallyltransferase MiaA [Bacteroidales bacterium]|nr:tRNA (adenosine(37)-N6)-dimethylallyltransferase MiaA [Bacteroidales bacterium]MBQ3522053.1 tRNA (adenosine(37)-N6)-dimethylallyltransferase MiaA [Bacteroidales bacterium]
MEKPELTIILGPTGVGKTDYAIDLALEYGSPVISCDSRQIFKEMKIGTAPPSPEQLERVKHYFIFSHSVTDYYTAGRYEIEALELLGELFKTHKRLVMAGGSGLYIDALCNGLDDFPPADQDLRERLSRQAETAEGLAELAETLKKIDPQSYENIDLCNRQRVVRAVEVTMQTGRKFSDWRKNQKKERPFSIHKIGIMRDREELYDRINRRVDIMMDNGLLDEVKSLKQFEQMPALRTVGYKEIFDHLNGEISLEKAVELIKRNSRRYAKKQLTYWGRDKDIEWMTI